MPKKFLSENTKAVVAKERKQKVHEATKLKTQEIVEDAKWKDNDKLIKKKAQRKENEEKKKTEQAQKKKEVKELMEKENESLVNEKRKARQKITRAQIEANKEQEVTNKPKKELNINSKTHITTSLMENLNILELNENIANTIDEAIFLLGGVPETQDKHPEKRRKAEYAAFEEHRLVKLKQEFPKLKLSQLKQKILKEWKKIQGPN